jgi:hypothetical protein
LPCALWAHGAIDSLNGLKDTAGRFPGELATNGDLEPIVLFTPQQTGSSVVGDYLSSMAAVAVLLDFGQSNGKANDEDARALAGDTKTLVGLIHSVYKDYGIAENQISAATWVLKPAKS